MIHIFAGDPFLVRRSARALLKKEGRGDDDVIELGEGMDVEQVMNAAAQGGLFGSAALLLDFDAAFQGQAGTKARNAVMKALDETQSDALIVVMDASATDARLKKWRDLGTVSSQPTPRYAELRRWIATELKAQDVRVERGVTELLADLFGEDLPGLAAEISKLAVLDEVLSEERVDALVHRPATRGAFDLIDAIVAGDEATAVRNARLLLDAGEPPPRILGALGWQLNLVAQAVGLRDEQGDVPDVVAAKELGVARFPAKKAMTIARDLGERDVAHLADRLLDIDMAVKTGQREARWAVEAAALELAMAFAARRR